METIYESMALLAALHVKDARLSKIKKPIVLCLVPQFGFFLALYLILLILSSYCSVKENADGPGN